MQKGKNQTIARELNLSLVMGAFKRRSMSRADISRIFHLSKPVASKIAAELEEMRLICPRKAFTRKLPGVVPRQYEINAGLGLLATIDLSSPEVRVGVSAFNGNPILERQIQGVETVRMDGISYFCDCLDDLAAAPECAGQPILSLCVAMPCRVDKNTGRPRWSERFEIDPDFDLAAYLKARYGAAVTLKNDVQLYMLAEKNQGGLITEAVKYALLVYVDAGIGGSFFIDGRPEDGFSGFAGEIGYFPVVLGGEAIPLDSAASLNAIKKNLRLLVERGDLQYPPGQEDFRFRDIKNAYLTGKEKQITDAVNESAAILAEAIGTLVKILNIYCVILNGRAIQFGEKYLKIINDAVRAQIPEAEVCFSALGRDAVREGSALVGIDAIIDGKIMNRENKSLPPSQRAAPL
ncbi:MAG: ROK family protein [Clostridiales bacterium]|jgi:predicted NBD/HSP70 family sugar kinase|nr:ROK family protein [Clostridiales bacterium]